MKKKKFRVSFPNNLNALHSRITLTLILRVISNLSGVDVNGAHDLGWAPLHVAAVNGRREVNKKYCRWTREQILWLKTKILNFREKFGKICLPKYRKMTKINNFSLFPKFLTIKAKLASNMWKKEPFLEKYLMWVALFHKNICFRQDFWLNIS